MAAVIPEILSLNPGNQVVIHLWPDHVHGASGSLTLNIQCDIQPDELVNLHLTLQILDPDLFRFVTDDTSMDYYFNNVRRGNIVNPVFRIMNIQPVVAAFRIRVIANDINDPGEINGDFKQYNVLTN